MTRSFEHLELPSAAPGTVRRVPVHRFGERGGRPKAYLQAGLHADELPSVLVLSHLARLLDAADRAGEVSGDVVVVPMVNPIGLSQWLNQHHVGRYAFGGEGNFNRGWSDLADDVAARVDGRLGADARANVTLVREAALAANAQSTPASELAWLRRAVLALSLDADVVLDLHCDNDSLMHVFVGTDLWPDAADLSADVGSRATLLATESGGSPFDEAFSKLWHDLGARFGDRHPLPAACLSATVEYRGSADVHLDTALEDARALLRFLRRRGLVTGDPGPLPEPLCEATPLEATEVLRAPCAGVLSYRRAIGDRVSAGEPIADLIDPSVADPIGSSTTLVAGTDGLMLSARLDKLVRPGDSVAKIVGVEPVRSGRLSED